jgi:hypothetical protein
LPHTTPSPQKKPKKNVHMIRPIEANGHMQC